MRSCGIKSLYATLLWTVCIALICTSFALTLNVADKSEKVRQPQAHKQFTSKFNNSRRPFIDPHGMFPECIGYEHVKFINSLCQKVFFDQKFDALPSPSLHNALLATLFDLPPGVEANSMLNQEKAQDSISRDKVKPYRVIAMSVFGKNTRYTRGLFRNMISLLLEPQFQGWILRVYYDHTIPNQLTHLMKGFGVEMYHVQYKRDNMDNADTSGSFWRFMVLLDTSITRYLMRDSDMKLSIRDASAVNEWIESGLPFHVQRDQQAHHNTILAGMWGSVGGYLDPHSKELFNSIPKQQILEGGIRYGGDQDWLRDVVWPKVQSQTISHDVFYCSRFDNVDKRGYPMQRIDKYDFVGNMYRAEEDWMGVTTESPADPACLRNKSWVAG